MMNSARTGESSLATSVTLRPGVSDRDSGSTPHAFANLLRIAGSLTAFRADLPPQLLESEFPLLDLDGTVVVELVIEDQTALFVIDTGAVPTTVQPDRGFRGAVYGHQMTRFDAGGTRSVHVQSVVLDSLSLGHVERRSFAVDLGEFNLLGADFLQGTALFIDAGEGRGVLRSLR